MFNSPNSQSTKRYVLPITLTDFAFKGESSDGDGSLE